MARNKSSRNNDGNNNNNRNNNFDSVYDANRYGCNDNRNQGYMQQQPYPMGGQPLPPMQQPMPYQYNNFQPGNNQSFRESANPIKSMPNDGVEALQSAVNRSVSANDVVVMSPRNYPDVKVLIDNLAAGKSVIVNISLIDERDGQRVLDFLSGAIYALKGTQTRVSSAIFLFNPGGRTPININDLLNH